MKGVAGSGACAETCPAMMLVVVSVDGETTYTMGVFSDFLRSRRWLVVEALAINIVTAVILALAAWLWDRASAAFSPHALYRTRESIVGIALLLQSVTLVALSWWYPPRIHTALGLLRRVLRNILMFTAALVVCGCFVNTAVMGIAIWSLERYEGTGPFLIVLGISTFYLLLSLCGLIIIPLFTFLAVTETPKTGQAAPNKKPAFGAGSDATMRR